MTGATERLDTNGGPAWPAGFSGHVGSIGIKDSTPDFSVIIADELVAAAGVFTQSLFAGPSVLLSREHVRNGNARAIVTISKNANVATGAEGADNAREVIEHVASALGADPTDVLLSSTGVIGRQYPMDRVRNYFSQTAENRPAGPSGLSADASPLDVATAIMTTDTHPKVAVASIAGSDATVVGVAKGVGMIEPNMATMLTYLVTDASVEPAVLDRVFRAVVDRTFNSLSVDTDTSTSDTAIVLASGKAGEVDVSALADALMTVCVNLTEQLARDGEGAETLLTVTVSGARDQGQARRVSNAIVNSPLVKTAVHGADPNWGRVAMAIGKCSDETDIEQENVRISFGGVEVYPAQIGDADLAALEKYLATDAVSIEVDLGLSDPVTADPRELAGREFLNTSDLGASWTVFGCDLTDGYVRINADYTT